MKRLNWGTLVVASLSIFCVSKAQFKGKEINKTGPHTEKVATPQITDSNLKNVQIIQESVEKVKIPTHGLSKMDGGLRYSEDFSHFDFVNLHAPKGGRVTIGNEGTFESFNPWISKGVEASKIFLTRSTLLVRSPEEPFSVYMGVADKVELSKDRSWAIFHIRPEARWENNVPITAEDVIFSWETWLKQGKPFMRTYYAQVEKMVVLEDGSLKMFFKPASPPNRELPLILSMMPLLSKKVYAGKDLSKIANKPLLSNGPYFVKDYDLGKYIVFKRNPNFWGKDLPVYKGRYNFDEIKIEYFRDYTSHLEAFKSGKLNYIEEASPQKWLLNYQFENNKNIQKEELQNQTPVGMIGFAFNTRLPIFQSKKVRKALSLIFDFSLINRSYFSGKYARITSFFENGPYKAQSLITPEEKSILKDLFVGEKIPKELFVSEKESNYKKRARIKQALALLAEEGWILNSGRLVNKTTKKDFTFTIFVPDAFYEKIALSYVRNLKDIGIKVKLRLLEKVQYEQRKIEFDYEMILISWFGPKSPGNELLNHVTSQASWCHGSRNYPGISDPFIDQIVERIIKCSTEDQLMPLVKVLDRFLCSGYYIIPLGYLKKDMVAFQKGLHHPAYGSKVESRLESWWFEKEKACQRAT